MNKITKLFAVALLFVASPSLIAMEAVAAVNKGAVIEAPASLVPPSRAGDSGVETAMAVILGKIAETKQFLAERELYDAGLAKLIEELKRGAAAAEQAAVSLREEQGQREGQ